MFMQIARVASMRSTCHRLNVGAAVVHNKSIISLAYNGPPSGQPHCQGNDCILNKRGGCSRAIHAEENALLRIPEGLIREDLTLYVTHSPCKDCSELISLWNDKYSNSLKTIVYETAYRDTSALDELAKEVDVYRLTPSGYLMNHLTKQVYNHREQE